MARLGRGFPIRPHIAPPPPTPHTETVSQHGTVVFSAPVAGLTFHRAPRVDEVYIEAVTRATATAQLDQVYVEVWTKEGWRGWGIVL